MAGYELTTTPVEKHRLRALFLKIGVSAQGTEQFMTAQIITNAADRQAIAEMMIRFVNPGGFQMPGSIRSHWYLKFEA